MGQFGPPRIRTADETALLEGVPQLLLESGHAVRNNVGNVAEIRALLEDLAQFAIRMNMGISSARGWAYLDYLDC